MKRAREDGGSRQAVGVPPPSKKAASGKGGGAKTDSGGLTTHDALGYLREVKLRFQDQKAVYDQFLEIMKDFKAARIDTPGVVARVKTLFKGDRELILGFNTFLPKGYEITMEDLKEKKTEKQPVEFDQAISYVNKIKKRFASDERVYRAFLEILNMYRKAQKTITQVYDEVALLFRGHTDLLEEFTYFLPETKAVVANQPKKGGKAKAGKQREDKPLKIPGKKKVGSNPVAVAEPKVAKVKKEDAKVKGEPGAAKVKSEQVAKGKVAAVVAEPVPPPDFDSTQQYLELVRTRLRNRDAYQDFLKLLHLFGQEIVSMAELKHMVTDILARYPDLMAGFEEFLKHGIAEMDGIDIPAGKITAKDAQKARQQAANQMSKFLTRPIAELDLSACEMCTPSYRLLPRNYPHFKITRRTALGRQLLNDKWVGVTSGSEDYSFKHMRKNQYEENLFRVEDDKFELDMLVECNKAAIRRMEPVAAQIAQMRPDEKAAFRMSPDVLKPIHMRVIEKIYGEQGASLVALLRKNPSVAVPVVLTRLQQKAEEWEKVKVTMEPLWQKTFDQNFHKSLDHRSFYFKQMDKRQLGSKTMVNELRDAAEKRRAGVKGLGAISMADEMRERLDMEMPPDMLLDFSDMEVHEDVYRVVLAAVEEMLNNKTARKVMDVWVNFVEAFLRLPPRKLPSFETDDEEADNTAGSDAPQEAKAGKHHNKHRMKSEDDEDDEDDDADEGKHSASADGEGDEEGREEDVEARFARCRPVAAGAMAGMRTPQSSTLEEARGQAGAAGQAGPSGGGTARGGPIFYSNDTVYVMLRLYYFLYDRLRVARQCASQHKPCQRGQAPGEASGSPEETHERFMKMVMDVIDGTLEPGQYEDDCRALMGTNSYVLYTLDKLIYKLIKQLQALLAEELGSKLISLWHYEAARTNVLPGAKEVLYYSNSHVLMHDDMCFRFAIEPGQHKVRVNLLEPNRIEVTPGLLDYGFSSYIHCYIASFAGENESNTFLRRSLPKHVRGVAAMSGDEAVECALQEVLKGAELVNGLECKLNCATSKVSYVLETEDSFVSAAMLARRGKRGEPGAPAAAAKTRAAKFREWMVKRGGEIKAEEAEAAAEAAVKEAVRAATKAAREAEEAKQQQEKEEEGIAGEDGDDDGDDDDGEGADAEDGDGDAAMADADGDNIGMEEESEEEDDDGGDGTGNGDEEMEDGQTHNSLMDVVAAAGESGEEEEEEGIATEDDDDEDE